MQEFVKSVFDKNTTAEQVASGYDLTGKNVIITGANSGIGKEAARVLGNTGANVTLAVRNYEAGLQAVKELKERALSTVSEANFSVSILDISSKQSIKDFCSRYAEENKQLDILISNAGIMGVEKSFIDGLESQMAVNFFGHCFLSASLAPLLKSATNARIVTLTSIAHHIANIDFDDFNFEKTDYVPMVAYGRSKTANVLLAVALHNRLASFGITSLAVHPGVIHETGLNRSMSEEAVARIAASAEGTNKTIETGAATSVWAAISELFIGKGGLYLEDCSVAELINTPESESVHRFKSGVFPYALDSKAADRLWTQAEKWLGQPLDIT
ncbi:SDR family NAD(P)-dependent oxidoreductase [Paraglaciecola sp. 20A4]|uniref:SDR family NAD(P)-dependent oxidoreductase n=1 Tax=Paraglaciecola sp. 20A4 TaxID=2687288 RepID=UPI00140C7233|nr:SDR family NAD(P)-dependent oxidoreductase [Paraglaciecola sp. 20A4]